MALVVGLDFDNTLVDYGPLFHRLYAERFGPAPHLAADKTAVRDAVRGLADGETAWRELQALAYGPRIGEAELFEGAAECVRACRQAGARVCVVSHKTERPGNGASGPDLRQAALGFMAERGFFSPEGLGLCPGDVFFCSTRGRKAVQAARLGCTHFVDDLPEVFAEPDFPPGADKILFRPGPALPAPAGLMVKATWREIGAHLLADRGVS
jgi:hypothetical protein